MHCRFCGFFSFPRSQMKRGVLRGHRRGKAGPAHIRQSGPPGPFAGAAGRRQRGVVCPAVAAGRRAECPDHPAVCGLWGVKPALPGLPPKRPAGARCWPTRCAEKTAPSPPPCPARTAGRQGCTASARRYWNGRCCWNRTAGSGAGALHCL